MLFIFAHWLLEIGNGHIFNLQFLLCRKKTHSDWNSNPKEINKLSFERNIIVSKTRIIVSQGREREREKQNTKTLPYIRQVVVAGA